MTPPAEVAAGATAYERLSAQDRSFLVFEEPHHPMHLGALVRFEGGTLLRDGSRSGLARLRAHVRSRLHLAPRYRQRVAWVPILGRPVWVDDARFDVRRHVRHASLQSGDDAELRRLAARLFERPLDRTRPLWELWLVDGLPGDDFALLVKIHHAVADGISAFGLFSALLATEPKDEITRPAAWRPRPAPSARELLANELRHEMWSRGALAGRVLRTLAAPATLAVDLAPGLRAVGGLARVALHPPAATPHNRPLGPDRRFDWLDLDLEAVRAVKHRLGGTVNDVVLTIVTGAVRRHLAQRNVDPRDLDYRVVVPVSLRGEADGGIPDNRVSAWLARLPLDEADPLEQHARLQRATRRLKEDGSALGPGFLAEAAELAPPGTLELGVRLTARLHPYNLIVSNVPGPPGPLFLLDARLLGGYPQVPLFAHQGLGVALFSYGGRLCWGFNAEPEAMPDLAAFVAGVARSFDELRARCA